MDIPREFRLIRVNGFLYAVKIKNNMMLGRWQGKIRRSDCNKLLKDKTGICEDCGKEKKLTLHHEPPLYIHADGKRFKLCRDCHNNREIICDEVYGRKKMVKLVRCTVCESNNILDEATPKIYCKTCGSGTLLVGTSKPDEFELPFSAKRYRLESFINK
jgi:DNA-directed RNA polymerase subunit RPC12/RpoP